MLLFTISRLIFSIVSCDEFEKKKEKQLRILSPLTGFDEVNFIAGNSGHRR